MTTSPGGGHPARRFLLLHGYRNRRPVGHWQWWLAEQLRCRGEQVLYPQLPCPDRPDPGRWVAALSDEYRQLGDGERVVICHSLGCALWYLAASTGALRGPADRVLLVAPAGPSELARERLDGFAVPWQADILIRSSRTRIRLVASDNDPTSPEGPAAVLYGRPFGLDAETLPGAGHITTADGFGPWPAALNWCLDPAARFVTGPLARRL